MMPLNLLYADGFFHPNLNSDPISIYFINMLFGGGFVSLSPTGPQCCFRDDSYGESDPNSNSIGSVSYNCIRECSGSVVECLTRDQGFAGSSLTGVTALCPLARHINPCLVLVQPTKTRPDITEKLLTET